LRIEIVNMHKCMVVEEKRKIAHPCRWLGRQGAARSGGRAPVGMSGCAEQGVSSGGSPTR
jgi:hypothetical protein